MMRLWNNKILKYVALLLIGAGSCAALNSYAAAHRTPDFEALTTSLRAGRSGVALMQAGKMVNPEDAAQALYRAWKKRARRAALKVASRGAVDKLFSLRWRVMKFRGCKHTEDGVFECKYHDPRSGDSNDLDFVMNVGGGASAGYSVASVSFAAEAISLPREHKYARLHSLEQFDNLPYEPPVDIQSKKRREDNDDIQ